MDLIKESVNEHKWPRKEYKQIEARKRDLIIRIADWTKDKDEPAFDVEVYIGGVYDWDSSEVFSTRKKGKKAAKQEAIAFASFQIAKFL